MSNAAVLTTPSRRESPAAGAGAWLLADVNGASLIARQASYGVLT